jgi:hypothetical protein
MRNQQAAGGHSGHLPEPKGGLEPKVDRRPSRFRLPGLIH